MFSFIKDLRFFYFAKKKLQKFYSHNFVTFFFNFSEIIRCSQIMWLCFAVLEFENVICVVNLLFEIYNALRYGWSFGNF